MTKTHRQLATDNLEHARKVIKRVTGRETPIPAAQAAAETAQACAMLGVAHALLDVADAIRDAGEEGQ